MKISFFWIFIIGIVIHAQVIKPTYNRQFVYKLAPCFISLVSSGFMGVLGGNYGVNYSSPPQLYAYDNRDQMYEYLKNNIPYIKYLKKCALNGSIGFTIGSISGSLIALWINNTFTHNHNISLAQWLSSALFPICGIFCMINVLTADFSINHTMPLQAHQ